MLTLLGVYMVAMVLVPCVLAAFFAIDRWWQRRRIRERRRDRDSQ